MYIEAIYYCTPAILAVVARGLRTVLFDEYVWCILDQDFWKSPHRDAPSEWTRLRFEQFVGLLTEQQQRAIALTLRCWIGDTESLYEHVWRYWAALAGLDADNKLHGNS